MSGLPVLEAFVDGPDGAPWVTFVPGIGNDADFWRPQSDELASDHRTLRFEPWGCGGSEPPPEEVTIDDVAASIVELWNRVGADQSSIVGLGFGGSTALYTALRHPDRVNRVVACCCRPRQPETRRQFWRDRQRYALDHGMVDLAEITVERWLSPEFRKRHPDVDDALRAAFRRNSVEGYSAYAGAFATMDFASQLAGVRAPSLLIAAEHDHGGGPIDSMREMLGAIPDAHLAVVPGSGHICNHEAPEFVNRLIRGHLAVIDDNRSGLMA